MVPVDDATGLAGLVLCGGASRRMGLDKALLPVDGERLVDRAARRLAAVAHPVILACGGRPLTVPGCLLAPDADEGLGPLAGLVAGLALAPHVLTAVVAVDMPWFDTGIHAAMAASWRDEDALIPLSGHGAEPLHGVFARTALPVLEDALGARRLRLGEALARLRVRHVDAAGLVGAARAARFATNLNTRADLLTLRASAPAAG